MKSRIYAALNKRNRARRICFSSVSRSIAWNSVALIDQLAVRSVLAVFLKDSDSFSPLEAVVHRSACLISYRGTCCSVSGRSRHHVPTSYILRSCAAMLLLWRIVSRLVKEISSYAGHIGTPRRRCRRDLHKQPNRLGPFSSHKRLDMGLRDADDVVPYSMTLRLIHLYT